VIGFDDGDVICFEYLGHLFQMEFQIKFFRQARNVNSMMKGQCRMDRVMNTLPDILLNGIVKWRVVEFAKLSSV
jgi:hypothetical protein